MACTDAGGGGAPPRYSEAIGALRHSPAVLRLPPPLPFAATAARLPPTAVTADVRGRLIGLAAGVGGLAFERGGVILLGAVEIALGLVGEARCA